MTALFSINLQIAGSNLSIGRETPTIFTATPTMALFGGVSLLYRKLIVSLILVVIFKIIIDLYAAPSGKQPSTVRSGKSSILYVIYTPYDIRAYIKPCVSVAISRSRKTFTLKFPSLNNRYMLSRSYICCSFRDILRKCNSEYFKCIIIYICLVF